jgi:hypothetical protein
MVVPPPGERLILEHQGENQGRNIPKHPSVTAILKADRPSCDPHLSQYLLASLVLAEILLPPAEVVVEASALVLIVAALTPTIVTTMRT